MQPSNGKSEGPLLVHQEHEPILVILMLQKLVTARLILMPFL